jgi:fermentation-respiration switch protein FrsA (DUF1100 family)
MLFLYIALALIVIIIGLSFYISRVLFFPKIPTHERCLEWEIENKYYDPEKFESLDIEDVEIETDGLKLIGKYINNHSDKTLIFAHGYTSCYMGAYKYLTPYLEENFNILMFDQRAHGLSEGKNPTLGYKEHLDFMKWVDFINEKTPHLKVLGCHGESMGGATVLLGGHHTSIDFVVSDCAFATFQKQVEHHISLNKLPKWLVYPTSLLSRVLYGAPIILVRPVDNVKHITAPLLLVHGDSDTYITVDHYFMLKEELQEKDSFYFAKDADHAESYKANRELYDQTVKEFLKKNNMI